MINVEGQKSSAELPRQNFSIPKIAWEVTDRLSEPKIIWGATKTIGEDSWFLLKRYKDNF